MTSLPEDIRISWNEAIQRGMEFLDGYFETPEWVNRIDLDKLTLDLCDSCVCGQLFNEEGEKVGLNSGYDYAVQYVMEQGAVDDEGRFAARHYGFFLPDGYEDIDAVREHNNAGVGLNVWDLFTQEWITAIEKRRANLP